MTIERTVLAAWLVAALVFGALALGTALQGPARETPSGVSVFLDEDITDAQQSEVRAALEQLEIVREVTLVSKADAYDEFRQLYKDQPALIESVTPDLLTAVFRVKVRSTPEGLDDIRMALRGVQGVDEVSQGVQEGVADLPSGWKLWRDRWGLGALGLLIPMTIVAGALVGRRRVREHERRVDAA